MGRWGLVVEENQGSGEEKMWALRVLAHVDGTREEALARLESWARTHRPEHPRRPGRRLVYRQGEGFLTVTEGRSRDCHCRFSVLELLYDSEAPEPQDGVPPGY